MDNKSQVVDEARIAFNRVSGKIPQRARKTEKEIKGKKLDEQSLRNATTALKGELELTSDFRASGQYRVDVTCAIFKRTLQNSVNKLSGEKILV
jgi:xanthine dehydrogenase iron-sulfur cluster and FAD-binding subunit A